MTTNEIMRMAMACVSAAIRENNSDKPDSSCSGVANLGLYQAIDALVSERDALKAALEHVSINYQATLSGHPVRDADECLSAARAALKGKT